MEMWCSVPDGGTYRFDEIQNFTFHDVVYNGSVTPTVGALKCEDTMNGIYIAWFLDNTWLKSSDYALVVE